jgi:hypothetical protein
MNRTHNLYKEINAFQSNIYHDSIANSSKILNNYMYEVLHDRLQNYIYCKIWNDLNKKMGK